MKKIFRPAFGGTDASGCIERLQQYRTAGERTDAGCVIGNGNQSGERIR